MAKKVTEPKFRKLEKLNGKANTKIGKFYQIGDNHSVKSEKVMRIETNQEITEHDAIDSLPTDLKVKQEKKEKKK